MQKNENGFLSISVWETEVKSWMQGKELRFIQGLSDISNKNKVAVYI